jgi:hypothetical protein
VPVVVVCSMFVAVGFFRFGPVRLWAVVVVTALLSPLFPVFLVVSSFVCCSCSPAGGYLCGCLWTFSAAAFAGAVVVVCVTLSPLGRGCVHAMLLVSLCSLLLLDCCWLSLLP